MNIQEIKNLGELKAAGYQSKSLKEELRTNLIAKIKKYKMKFSEYT